MPSNFLPTLRAQVDRALAGCLDDIRSRYALSESEPIVDEVIRATLPKGGRIRPLLCCLGYASVGGPGGAFDEHIVKAAASLELLHTFAIIHDDVMDASPMRRGEPSIHRRLADERLAAGGRDAELHGISLAILAGDLALVVSDLLFAGSGFARELLVNAYEPLSGMRLDAIAGQYLDLTHSGLAGLDTALTLRIARLKTGSYSVEGPLLVGATLGSASPEALKVLGDFGRPLGEAFQLADDILGMFGDPAVTGKDIENDLRRGKPTALIAQSMERAGEADARLIQSLWGNPHASAGDLAELRAAVLRSGGPDRVVEEIEQLVGEAVAGLTDPGIGLTAEARAILTTLAQDVRKKVLSSIEK